MNLGFEKDCLDLCDCTHDVLEVVGFNLNQNPHTERNYWDWDTDARLVCDDGRPFFVVIAFRVIGAPIFAAT